MNKSDIEEIENRLKNEHIEINHKMDDDDITEYFELPNFGSFKFTSDTLVEMTFGMALSHDKYSVDLVNFSDKNFYAVIFNMASAAGTYELIGISSGINPSPVFIRNSLIRWTKVENFKWPNEIEIKFPILLPLSVITELRKINYEF